MLIYSSVVTWPCLVVGDDAEAAPAWVQPNVVAEVDFAGTASVTADTYFEGTYIACAYIAGAGWVTARSGAAAAGPGSSSLRTWRRPPWARPPD